MDLKIWLKQYYWIGLILLLVGGGYFWHHSKTVTTEVPQTLESSEISKTQAIKEEEKTVSGSNLKTEQVKKETTEVIVDIKGAIKHPGIYHLNTEDRINDVIKKAGGFTDTADETKVNLAQKVQDQGMIYIPIKGEEAPAPQGNISTTGVSDKDDQKTVNLNTASLEELQQLDGIGAKKAEKIIDYRENQGPFQNAADLSKVNGFGEKTVARLQEQITV